MLQTERRQDGINTEGTSVLAASLGFRLPDGVLLGELRGLHLGLVPAFQPVS